MSKGPGIPWVEGEGVSFEGDFSFEELAARERRQLANLKRAAKRAGDYHLWLSLQDAGMRMVRLLSIWDRFNEQERREELQYAWTSFDEPHITGDFALVLFHKVGFLADSADPLPEGQLTIYRGSLNGLAGRSWKSGTAFSWTLELDVARWFAQRLAGQGTGIVMRAKVDASDVLAYFQDRQEAEVIVDPASLREVEELPVLGRVSSRHPWIARIAQQPAESAEFAATFAATRARITPNDSGPLSTAHPS
jgi:hypothetical protein